MAFDEQGQAASFDEKVPHKAVTFALARDWVAIAHIQRQARCMCIAPGKRKTISWA